MSASIYNLPQPGPAPACPLPSLPSYDSDISIYSQDSDDCEWVLEMDPLDLFSEVAPPAAGTCDASFESSDDDDSAPATPTSAVNKSLPKGAHLSFSPRFLILIPLQHQQESESESEGDKPVAGVAVEKRTTFLKTLKAKLFRKV
ncbi:hypothetical protein DFS33DRAFT_1384260 [Desarmillaria ectypa]|nr:hypothetical protein DFS33DRAFT_1384260 [Desarmillaria ectypa]